MKILIVDDSKTQRLLLKKTLSKLNPQLIMEEADNGRSALELLEHSFSDAALVLSDWNMPDMDGMELLIKMRDQNIDIPFAFITSNLNPQFRDKAKEAGASFFIAKPHTDQDLSDILKRFSD